MRNAITKYMVLISHVFLFNQIGFSQNAVVAPPGGDKDWHMGGNPTSTESSSVFGTTSLAFNQPIFMYTGGAWRATLFNFSGGFAINRTALGTTTPGALLHIGDAFGPPGSGGHRTWMNVGTFCWQVTDNMYVGLKDETALFGVDAYDAIINWGDNNTAPNPGGSRDNLRFVFTEPTTSGGPGSGTAGLEVMRLLGNGNVGIGNWYVGPPFYIPPQRRLHVYQNANTPQFRVSYLLDANVGFGKYCDFQTTPNGDMAIFPFDGTQILNSDRPRNVGIQTATPGNTLEINYRGPFFSATSLNGITATSSGFSGLRFTDLKYGISTPATPAVNQGVLSIDQFGDIVYITSPGSGFGTCGNPVLQQTASVIGLNNNQFHFSGQQPGDHIGIGTTCTTPLFGKLTLIENSGVSGPVFGAFMTNTNDANGGSNICLVARSFQASSTPAGGLNYIGGLFVATGSKNCIAVDGLANGTAINGAINYGGRFRAQNGFKNYGIWAEAASNYPNNFAGFFQGDVNVNGTYYQNMVLFTSDQNLKTNIDSINNALAIISLIQPKTFFFDSTAHPQLNLSDRRQYGLIAQDVEPVLPELVGQATYPALYDTLGNEISPAFNYKTLNYNAFIAILIKGMQEQESKIDSLSNAMSTMQSQINGCCSSNARTQNPNQTDVTLTNSESIVLDQNIPNPYAEQTTITYNLPESVQKAQLLFYDATGKLIKAVDLDGRGKGQINVFANDLSNGIYSYALVVDGQIADTKRMVKTN